MALSIGDLVAYLRADDTGFVRGLVRARAAMTTAGRTIAADAREVGTALRPLGPAAAGIGIGIPAIAATGAALMGITAGAAAAGLAVGAFTAAVVPQMSAVSDVADLAEKAEEAAAEGGEKAAAATKAYKDALAELPPATRETAQELLKLKAEHKEWSEELAPKTMPVFTKGLNIIRRLLPTLTPFVETAARVFGNFLDEIGRGLQSAGFKQWAADMNAAAGPALTNFLAVIKNLAIGVGGLLQAFLPQSGQMTGGLVKMSEAFREWATSLEDSQGFQTFLNLAREGGPALGQLAIAAGNLLVALGPLIGITTQIALALAKVINALPPGVLTVLAGAIGTVVIGMKAYAAYTKVAAAASTIMGTATMRAAMRSTAAAGRSALAFARIAASATVNAARTAAVWAASAARMAATWLVQLVRVAVRTAAQFVMMAARAVAWAAVMAAQWLIAMGPVGWVIAAVAAVIGVIVLIATKTTWFQSIWAAVWGWLKSATAAAVSGILAAISWLGRLPGMVWGWIKSMAAGAIVRFLSFVGWVRGLPGRIIGAIASLAGRLYNSASNAVTRFRTAAVARFTAVVSWVRGLPGRIRSALGNLGSLLVGAGRSVVTGLWNGIRSMGGWLRSTLMGWAKSLIPGPIAKALGIGSPSRVMAQQVGRWIPAGIVSGIESEQRHLDRTMSNLVDPVGAGVGATAGSGGRGGAGTEGGRQTVRVVLDVTGADGEMKRMLRKIVRVDGGGNVQRAFG